MWQPDSSLLQRLQDAWMRWDRVPLSHTLYSEWHGLGAHLALPERWWCTPKKSSRCLALAPLCSRALLSSRKPSNSPLSTQDIGRRVILRCPDVSDMSCQLLTSCKVGGKNVWSFVEGLNKRESKKAISRSSLNGRWRTRHSLFPVTLSLNLYPVLVCQTPSQIVTLNMAVNSKSVV